MTTTLILLALSVTKALALVVPPLSSVGDGAIAALGGRLVGRRHIGSPHSLGLAALPAAGDVSTDDFMKQLGHASQIIPELVRDDLSEGEYDELLDVLTRQFSHSDGVRGFFAVYLTSPESLAVDGVPKVLAEAVRSADAEIIVPLACMNVVMPTAMTSVHRDEDLKECASKTASNGKKILRLLEESDGIAQNCREISNVCKGEFDGSDLNNYWKKFFENYKYGSQQKDDISLAISEFCLSTLSADG